MSFLGEGLINNGEMQLQIAQNLSYFVLPFIIFFLIGIVIWSLNK